MFRIEAFVDDKKLAEALRALAGLARGMPSVMPVSNVVERGKGKPKAKTDGSLVSMFESHLGTLKQSDIRPDDIRAFLKAHGKSAASMTYLATMAIKHKMLKRVGKSSNVRYTIIKKG
jgi:carbon monoxide dehydrogenase subunit G